MRAHTIAPMAKSQKLPITHLLIQPHGPMGQLSSGEEFAKNVEEHFRADAGTK